MLNYLRKEKAAVYKNLESTIEDRSQNLTVRYFKNSKISILGQIIGGGGGVIILKNLPLMTVNL